jgi:hypothetical protein
MAVFLPPFLDGVATTLIKLNQRFGEDRMTGLHEQLGSSC